MTANESGNSIKGVEFLLTIDDISSIIGKPPRFVREKLIRSGALKHIKFGGNSVRVRPVDFAAFLEKGQTGFRHAAPSGRGGAQLH